VTTDGWEGNSSGSVALNCLFRVVIAIDCRVCCTSDARSIRWRQRRRRRTVLHPHRGKPRFAFREACL